MAQGGAPIYYSEGEVPNAPRESVQPIQVTAPDASPAFAAVAQAGSAVSTFAEKKYQGEQETQAATSRATYLEKLSAAEQQFSQSDDWQNAPQKFQEARYQLASEAQDGINDPKQRADLQLHLTIAGLASQGKVNAAALKKQVDTGVAGLDAGNDDLLQRAARAGSPKERQAVVDTAFEAIDNAASAGNIGQDDAVKRKQLFLHGLSTADVARDVAADPARAIASLDDPKAYPSLTPFERQTLKAQAIAAYDERTRLQADDLAKRDPALAAARYGTVTTRALADQVYGRVIIPHESGGDPGVVGKAGEVGLGQILPETARAQAKKIGIADLDGKSDAEVTEALKNPELNTRIGSSLFSDHLQRYGGNVWAAAAAYNKGTARADDWDKAARAQFGDHYSAAQFASVVDSDVAKKYVLDVAKRIGADPGAPPLSFRGSYGVAGAVTAQLEHQANAQRSQDNALIALSQPDRDSIASAFRNGYATDPQAIQQAKQPLIDAAARGSTDATVKLRQFEDAQATYPLVVEAYKHTPEQVEGAVAALQAKVEKDGGTVQELRRLEVLQKVSTAMNEARRSNPVGLIERQLGPSSVSSVQPPKDIADPAFAGSLEARSVTASQANAAFGGEMKFFKPEEKAALKPWFSSLTPDGQGAALATIAAHTQGSAREAAFREITDGKPVTMYAAGLYAQDPAIASSILQGAAGVDTYVPSKSAGKQAYQTEKATALPPSMFTTSGRLDENGPYAAMSAAIDARYAYLAAQANDSSGNLNSSRLRQAASDVTGGVVWHNGTPTIAPRRGMSQSDFDGVVWGLSDKDLTGAQTSGGKAISADYLRGSAKLRARSDGTYYVQVNQDDAAPAYAVDKAGGPFVLDLRNRKPGAVPAPGEFDGAAMP